MKHYIETGIDFLSQRNMNQSETLKASNQEPFNSNFHKLFKSYI